MHNLNNWYNLTDTENLKDKTLKNTNIKTKSYWGKKSILNQSISFR